ncbi:hypothetical protein BJ165DRAFT_1533250 [Panaeolus papilionaceus]|nr:hypothetical protein BJ165DRAFT_1533250 [Panaeolus papilionaceus]
MWDTLHNEDARMRAESNFTQLRGGICKASTEDVCGISGVIDLVPRNFLERRHSGEKPAGEPGDAHQVHRTRLQAMIDTVQRSPPPTFLQPPDLPANESVAAIAPLGSSTQHATILGGVDAIPTTPSILSEEECLDHITTTPENPHAALDTGATPLSASREPVSRLHLRALLNLTHLGC